LPPDGAILAFDTSGPFCAAALRAGGRIVSQRNEPMPKGQAERLIPMLEEMLAEAGLGWPDLAALAVCTGPGNFTGVRIGVAAARGLALGLGVPAIGVTGLEALAHGAPRPVLACLDARRGQLYAQLFGENLEHVASSGAHPPVAHSDTGMRPPAPQAGAFAPTRAVACPHEAAGSEPDETQPPPATPELTAPDALEARDWPDGLSVTGAGMKGLAARLGARFLPPPANPCIAIAALAAERRATPQPRPAPLYLRPADATPRAEAPPVLLP